MPALNRTTIVDTAIGLIEREGADAVSMRRIAADLGVGVMSLYNHVPSKSALLDGVAEAVLQQIEFTDDPSAHWSDRIRAQGRAFRQIAHNYPRCTMVVMSRQLESTAGLLPLERALATLRGAGFDGHEAVQIFRVFTALVVGSLLREVGVTPTFAPTHRDGERVDYAVDPQLFPEISAAAGHLIDCDHDAEFDFGLELFIAAIEVRQRDAQSRAPRDKRL